MEIPLANHSYDRCQNLYSRLTCSRRRKAGKEKKGEVFQVVGFQPRQAAGPRGPASPHRSPLVKGRAGVSPRTNNSSFERRRRTWSSSLSRSSPKRREKRGDEKEEMKRHYE